MPSSLRSCLAGLLILGGSGCHLAIQKETVVVAFPPGRDEVKCLLVYEGFDVIGEDQKNLSGAQSDLRTLTTGQTFVLPVMPLWISLDEDSSDPERKQFYELLRKHLVLENGQLFHNEEGQLAFWQRLTIRDAQAFVEGLNEQISADFARFAKKGLALDRTKLSAEQRQQWEQWDIETLKLLEQAARDKHRWVTLEPGRIRFTMRGSEHRFRHLKGVLLKPGSEDNAAWLEWLARTPWSLEQRQNELTISLGVGGGEPIHLVVSDEGNKKPKSKHHQALMDYSKTLPVPVVKTSTAELVTGLLNEVKKKKEE